MSVVSYGPTGGKEESVSEENKAIFRRYIEEVGNEGNLDHHRGPDRRG